MFNKLPEFIDPISAVTHNKHFEGRVNQSRLKRLVEITESAEQDVQVVVDFYYDKALKFPAFVMTLETVLTLLCQRSLEPFEYSIKSEVRGVFTESMALTDDLPADIEVFELDEEKISLFDWVEEELLLSVPLVPMNQSSAMQYQNTDGDADDQPALDESADKPNPFAALQGLKDNM